MAELNNNGELPYLYKLFVGQIPKNMDELTLRQYFEEFGHIVEVSIIRDNITMMSKGCAFVTYSHENAAQLAVDKLHDKVQLPNALNPLQVRFAETPIDRENKLFVGMLPKMMGDQDLHDMFSIYGKLREVHVIRGPEGGSKGCAFVKFIEREAALAAIENLNEAIPPNATRPLVVKFADDKKLQQMSMHRHGGSPTHHMPPQQHMMYPYSEQQPVTAISAVGMQRDAPGGYHSQQQGPGYGARYGYPMHVPGGPAGPGVGYYPEPAMVGQQLSPVYGQKPDGEEGREFGGAGRSDAYDYGRKVLSPSSSPMQASQVPLDTASPHERPPEGPSGANLFIYHLPRDLTDADLATLFAPFGNVISAKVFVDKRSSESKGFGFVSYDILESANSAIKSMNGFQIGSKRLKVQHKRVMGGPHTAGMPHSSYGNIMNGAPPPHHMHMGHHVGYPYQSQQAPYSHRPAPMSLPPMHGVMLPPAPLMQHPQQMGNPGLPAPPMFMSMPAPQHAGRGGYNYSSYPADAPTHGPAGRVQQVPQQQMQQRPGMMLPARSSEEGYGEGMPQGYSTLEHMQQHGQLDQALHLAYMDETANPKPPQSQTGGNNGYYKQC